MIENNDNNNASQLIVNNRILYLGHPQAHVPGYQIPEKVAPPLSRPALILGFTAALVLAVVGYFLEHFAHGAAEASVALPWVAPFVLLLAAIATMPFIASHWWEHNYAKVAIGLGLLVGGYYLLRVEHGPANVARSLAEYISFIYLLGSLFVVSGGILIRVRAQSTPLANVILLLLGAVIANLFGTTGASMLLIRPYLRLNKGHVRPYHVVFFIFIIANAGGSLTPIGDPPLFLGYLKGVPFFWVLEHCWSIWALVVGVLLAVFYIFDQRDRQRNGRSAYQAEDLGPALGIYGGLNLAFIGLILAGILLHSSINAQLNSYFGFEAPVREIFMVVAAFASLAITPRRIHGENRFNYAPIREVAYLFIGIFLTMLPALNYLYHTSASGGSLLKTPGQYYFAVGSLSSVLDNAPTYLTFLKTELGALDGQMVDRAVGIAKRPGSSITATDLEGLDEHQQQMLTMAVASLVKYHGDRVDAGSLTQEEVRVGFLTGYPPLNQFLIAISMGAVLFGAMTYIGNGPNFMVKSIAENAGVPTPSFFGYVFRYAIPILLPVLVLAWVIFLR